MVLMFLYDFLDILPFIFIPLYYCYIPFGDSLLVDILLLFLFIRILNTILFRINYAI